MRRRGGPTLAEIRKKHGWDGRLFRVESSGNLGGSWSLECELPDTETAYRVARTSSSQEERLFRVVNADSGVVLCHYKGGATVYESRDWT